MYVNKFCWCGTIKEFLDLDPAAWLEQMKSAYRHVSPHPLNKGLVAAWKKNCTVLHRALPFLKPGDEHLHLIFEYGLPYNKHDVVDKKHACYADCIVVSESAVVVLEFRQSSVPLTKHAWKTLKYYNRLQDYHDESLGKHKWGILVPTHSTGLREKVYYQVQTFNGPIERPIPCITACSPDRLAEELEYQLRKGLGPKSSPRPVGSIVQWRESEYSFHDPLEGEQLMEKVYKRYCDNGCPYGQTGALCLLSRQLSCPIDEMYQNILVYQSGETRCAWCSCASDTSPSSRWPAQGHCGQCPQFCPACNAPHNKGKK